MAGWQPAKEGFDKIEQLIRRIEVALLTTVDREGQFHTRPVQTLATERDGTFWFFTDARSEKTLELGIGAAVGAAIARWSETAAQLVERGYRPVPIMPGDFSSIRN